MTALRLKVGTIVTMVDLRGARSLNWERTLSEYLPSALTQQAKVVRDLSGGQWSLDLELGLAQVGPLTSGIQMLGSYASGAQSWLSGWAVVETNNLNPNFGKRSFDVSELGEVLGVPELSEPFYHSTDDRSFEVALVSASLKHPTSVYRGPTDDGAVFFTLEDHKPEVLSGPLLVTTLSEILNLGLPDPKSGLTRMLGFENFVINEDPERIDAVRDDMDVRVEFDPMGRPSHVDINLRDVKPEDFPKQ